MRIVDIREKSVPVASAMRNAAFDFSEMTTSVVAVVTDVVRAGKPVVGYAFNSTGRYACGASMRARFIPRLLSASPDTLCDDKGTLDPEKALSVMQKREKPGGDAERSVPIGTIETAIWDALAKVLERPLWHLLAERYAPGRALKKVPCYVGGGWYQPGGGIASLQDEIKTRLADGYTQMKIKVGGAAIPDDLKRIEAALTLMGSAKNLAVDANAAFARDTAFAYAKALAPYGLRWFEEPCPPHDYKLFAELAAAYAPALATGENLYCLPDVENLLRFGGFRHDRDILQVDPPQAYGIATYARLVDLVESAGGSRSAIFPHGGNMMSFALVAGLGLGGCEAYPGVFGAFAGFADGMRVETGFIDVPDHPGIGFEAQSALYATMKELVDA